MLQCLPTILILSHVFSATASAHTPRGMILDKRAPEIFCSEFYGRPILSECRAARNEILHWEPFHRPVSPDALSFLAGAFEFFTANSRHNPTYGRMPRARLPAFFTSGGCQVALYMIEGVTEIESAINIYESAHRLTVRCADAKSQGGYTTLGMHNQISIYMYALDSDYLRLRERRDSCAQASTSGQSNIDCSNLEGPVSESGSSKPEPASSEQGPSKSSCSTGYATQPGDCCEAHYAAWSLLATAKVSLILGIQGSLGGSLISWCQNSGLHS